MTATEKKILSAIHQLPEGYQQHVLAYILSLPHTKDENCIAPKKLKQQRIFGSSKGTYQLAQDFDAPLDDFNEYM